MKSKIFISIFVTMLISFLLTVMVDGKDGRNDDRGDGRGRGREGGGRGDGNRHREHRSSDGRGSGGQRTNESRSRPQNTPRGQSREQRRSEGQSREQRRSEGQRRDQGGGRRDGNYNFSRNPSMSRQQVPQRQNYSSRPQREFRRQRTQSSPQPQQVQKARPQILTPSVRRQDRGDQREGQRRQFNRSSQQIRDYFGQSSVGKKIHDRWHSRREHRDSWSNVRQSLPHTLNQQAVRGNEVRQRFDHRDRRWFDRDFWQHHHHYPHYWNNYVNWWGAPSWTGINGWYGWGWNDPIYYQEGYPIYVNTTEQTNYLLTQPVQYPQNITIITGSQSGESSSGQEQEWMPLGVFALVNNVSDAATPNMVFQLATSKDGAISGSYYNTSSDQVYPVEGIVDRATQVAMWKMSVGEGAPIFQTGIFNLTKDQTAVEVTYADGSEQTWLLIRLPKPADQASE